MTDKTMLARLTAELVSSYVGNRSLSELELERAIERLPTLIDKVHESLLKILAEPAGEVPAEPQAPTVSSSTPPAPAPRPVTRKTAKRAASPTHPSKALPLDPQQTIFPDYLVCLEDGKPFKTLKRHLSAHYGMTPEAYRKKWNLPDDYPMAAPAYAASRAAIAKKIGLGASGRGGQPSVKQVKTATKTPASRRRGKALATS